MIFPKKVKRIGKCLAFIPDWYMHDGITPFKENRYGRIHYEGKQWQSNRLSYHLNVSIIPRNPCPTRKGLWEYPMVLHTCNHKWCIEPSHLYLGMHAENSQDMWNAKTPAEIEKFKSLMKKMCGDPAYRKRMSDATKGKPKTMDHRKNMSKYHEHRRLQFA